MAKKASTGNEGRTLGDRSQTGAIQQGDFGEIVGNDDASDRMSMCIGFWNSIFTTYLQHNSTVSRNDYVLGESKRLVVQT